MRTATNLAYTGGDPNLFTSTTGGSNLSVQTATSKSSPNALAVNVAGGGSYYAEKDYSDHYLQHELTWHLYLGADFAIGSGSYLVLAQLLPSASSSAGKVNVTLSSANAIRIDYTDTTGTQHYLYGNTVTTGAWHTIDVSETIGAGSGAITLQVDGTTNASGASLDLGQTGVGSFLIGAYSPTNAGTSGHLYVDDVTASGSACDSPPSAGVVFCNNLDGQAPGAVATGSGANQWTGVGGAANISVENTVSSSGPNALAAPLGGASAGYASKTYAAAYLRHTLTVRLQLSSTFSLAGGAYVQVAQILPRQASTVGKVDVVLPDTRALRLDYFDSSGTQRFLYGTYTFPLGSWHTVTLTETIGAHSTGSLSLQVDGSTAAGGTGLDLGAAGVTYVAVGNQYNSNPAGAAGTLYVDDVSATAMQSGQIPWHPHKWVRLSAGLRASVDLADGHVDVAADALSIAARGSALAEGQVWDSALAQAGIAGSAGQGWQTSLTPSMGGVLTSTVSYSDATGAVWVYPYTGALTATAPYTAYQTPNGLPWALTTSTAGYTLVNALSSATLAFDAQGRYFSDTDAYGNQNSLSYGASGPISETNSGGRVLSLAYSNGLLSDVQSPLWRSSGGAQGLHVTYGYNGSAQLTTLTRGAGTTDALTTTFGYSGTQLISVTTPYTSATHTWTLGYDPTGRLVSLTSPISGTVGQAGYTPAYTSTLSYNGNTTQVVDGAGTSGALTTTYTLEAAGEATQITDGLGDSSSATYDADHDVLTSTDANGNQTTNYYQYVGPTGATGLITQTMQPTIQPYSPRSTARDPIITSHHYNASNDLTETDLPEGGRELFGYDSHHGIITSTATTANNTTWRGSVNLLDQAGEVTGTVDGRGVSVNGSGVAALAANAASYTRHLSYNTQGDETSASTPPITTTLGGVMTTSTPVTTTSGYDGDGDQTSVIAANGTTTTTGYDHLGRPVTTTLPPVPLWTSPTGTTVDDSVQGTGPNQFNYQGSGWVHCTVPPSGSNCSTLYWTATNSADRTTNEVVSVAFTGTGITYYATTGTNRGIVAVSVDGGSETLVDLYAAPGQGNVVAYSTTGLANGSHTLQIRVTGTKNASSADTYVTVDRVDIVTPATSTPTVTTQYDGDGNMVQQIDGNGDVTQSSHDPLGRLVVQTNPVAGTTVYTANATEQTAVQDPQGNVTSDQYDAAGRLITQTAPISGVVQYQYDPAGNTTGITSADTQLHPLQIDTRQYDALNRVITDTVSGPGSPSLTTATRYDHDGNVYQVVRPAGDAVVTTYDLADEPLSTEVDTQTVLAATHQTQSTSGYDTAGNQTQAADYNGDTTTTSYDGDNRVVQSVAVTGTSTITTTPGYDPDGNALTTTRQTDAPANPVQTTALTATYNAADWQVSTDSDGDPTTYGYDGAGQQRTQTILNGVTPITNTLNAEGLVTATTESLGVSTPYLSTFASNANDLPVTTTLNSGSTQAQETAQYDQDSRLTRLLATGPATATAPLASTYGYGYNAVGWTTGVTSTLNGVTTTQVITHDALGRLTGVQSGSSTQSFTYDGNGNLTQAATNGSTTSYSYNNSVTPNEVLTLATPGQPTTYYGYDTNGDGTSITSTGALSTGLSYDSQARLVGVTLKDGTSVSLSYNAAGQRASYVVSKPGQPTLTQTFQYRGDELGQAVVVTGTTTYTDTYLYTQAGLPLELLRQQNGTTSRYWYVLDGRGNVVALADSTGNVVDRYAYDVWGALTSVSESVPQRLRYAGYWYDQELGWYWVGVRLYDPSLKRLLQPDPSQTEGVRTYVYVGSDPIDSTDPSGTQTLCDVLHTCTPGCAVLTSVSPGSYPICGQQASLAREVYMFLIGEDLSTLGSGAGFQGKSLAVIDLLSNVTLLIPVEGAVDRAAVRTAITAGRDLAFGGTQAAERAAYKRGRPVKAIEKTLQQAVNPEQYLYDVAKKYGINLRGVRIVYDPTLGAGIQGVTKPQEGGRVIRIGREALGSDAQAANTIAHELNHARDLIRNGRWTGTEAEAIAAGDALESWINGGR